MSVIPLKVDIHFNPKIVDIARRNVDTSFDLADCGLARWLVGTASSAPAARAFAVSMSALGHKQTSRDARVMSALPPKADIRQRIEHVRFVPITDVCLFRASEPDCELLPLN